MSHTFIPRAAVLVGTVVLLIIAGCVSLTSHQSPPLIQTNKISIASGEVKEIIFPVRFASAPEVKVEDGWMNDVKVVECKADRICIRNNGFQTVDANWTATGERAVPTDTSVPKKATAQAAQP